MTTATDSPGWVIELFAERMNSGDLEGALALYEPGATFAPQPGTLVSGLEQIREALTQFFALEPTINGEIEKVVAAGDTALIVNRWSLEGTTPDGQSLTMEGKSADVVRRQSDGRWLILIDDPWGA